MGSSREKHKLASVFIKNSTVTQKVLRGYTLRHNIIPYRCNVCGCDGRWQQGIISLELDHIDGDNTNNEVKNLRYLCPNCHAMTSTYRGKNKNTHPNTTVTDAEFTRALEETPNIRQALMRIGLAPKGANYSRAKKLLELRTAQNKCVETIHQQPTAKSKVKT